ncbi:MAG: penicillin acylase family protein [Pseudomonadota bacterium]
MKQLLRVMGGLVTAAVALVGYVLWSTLPDYSGELHSEQLSDRVSISRDEKGVPLIRAKTFNDAAFGLGFAQAQDRMWQMATLRRAVRGETAALFGTDTLPIDVQYRIVAQLPRIAERSEERLDPKTRATFQAFADGVNLAIRQGQAKKSPEWLLFGSEPEPWTASDVNNFVTVVAETATDAERELRQAEIEEAYTEEFVQFLREPLGSEFPTLYSDFGDLAGSEGASANSPVSEFASTYADAEEGVGTNFFVFGPEKTRSGKPILAVDPHLPTQVPSVIYPVRIELPEDFIIGGAWVGTPAVVFGQNSRIAWGMTHLYADTVDYVVEKVDPASPDHYMTPGGSKRFETTAVEIPVRGQDSVRITVRRTENGIVVSDPFLPPELDDASSGVDFSIVERRFGPGHVVVRKDAASVDGYTSIQALMNVSRAHNWSEFREALRDYEWTNNVAYADVDGNIGVQMAAKMPRRVQLGGWNGQRLARGWLGEGRWDGFIDFDDLAVIFNPAAGWVADSNSRAVAGDHPFRVTSSFSPPWRVLRAYERIGPTQEFDVAQAASVQLDVYSEKARRLVPRILAALPAGERAAMAQKMLADWDFEMSTDRPEPLLFDAVEASLQQLLLNSRGPALARRSPNTGLILRMLENDRWCDVPTTDEPETCDDVINTALGLAVTAISQEHGDDLYSWRWGDEHQAEFAAIYSWDYVPVIKRLTNVRVATPGGQGVLNQGSVGREQAPLNDLLRGLDFDQVHGATFRLIADLADPRNSVWAFAPGVSGNPLSTHWDDAAAPWAAGEYDRLLVNQGDDLHSLAISPR